MQSFQHNSYFCAISQSGRAAVSSVISIERNLKMITLFFLSIHASFSSDLLHSRLTRSFSRNAILLSVNYSVYLLFIWFLGAYQRHFDFYYTLVMVSITSVFYFYYSILIVCFVSPYLKFIYSRAYCSAKSSIIYGKN